MADIITITEGKHWSAAAWISRLVIRAVHAFLPSDDEQCIAQQFENFQNGAHPDLTDFTSSEMQVIYSAALQAYEHVLATGLSSDIFKHPDFTPSEDFLRRFCPKFEQFVQLLGEDDRVDSRLPQLHPTTTTHMIGQPTPDARVERLLEQLEFKYEISDDGTYSVVFAIDDERSQEVNINSQTEFLDKLEIRDVWSIAFVTEAPLHADIANALLIQNADLKMGAWELSRRSGDSDGVIASFRISIAATTSSNALQSAMHMAAKIADEVEQKFTGEDRF